MPLPGAMVNLSPAFEPVLIKGLKVHPENPFLFDFIIDTGVSLAGQNSSKQEASKLIKYFLASLTIPEKDLWVNLSPYEKDRMIAPNLGQTQMGRDMLAQDYILKQLTASLIYPEKHLGKVFWDKVYSKAQQLYGTTQIPVNTFNKVWIVADKADVLERGNTAYVVGAHLKVMMEEDYLSMSKHADVGETRGQDLNIKKLGSDIVRAIILPELEKEVNTGKNFASLRQMFYSMILAGWYKMALKDAILSRIYVDKSKVKVGVNQDDPQANEEIFQRYLKAYKKGVFNYIKEEPSPRRYFSGGTNFAMLTEGGVLNRIKDPAMMPSNDSLREVGNLFDVAMSVNPAQVVKSQYPVMASHKEYRKFNMNQTIRWIIKYLHDHNQMPVLTELSQGLGLSRTTLDNYYLPIIIQMQGRLKRGDYNKEDDQFKEKLREALKAKKQQLDDRKEHKRFDLEVTIRWVIEYLHDPNHNQMPTPTELSKGLEPNYVTFSNHYLEILQELQKRLENGDYNEDVEFQKKLSRILEVATQEWVDRTEARKQTLALIEPKLKPTTPDDKAMASIRKYQRFDLDRTIDWIIEYLHDPNHNQMPTQMELSQALGPSQQTFSNSSLKIFLELRYRFRRGDYDKDDDPEFKGKLNKILGISNEDKAMATKGGIDFDRNKMRMNVRKEGPGVRMQLNAAMIKRIQQEGFDGMEFQIESVVPVADLSVWLTH